MDKRMCRELEFAMEEGFSERKRDIIENAKQ